MNLLPFVPLALVLTFTSTSFADTPRKDAPAAPSASTGIRKGTPPKDTAPKKDGPTAPKNPSAK